MPSRGVGEDELEAGSRNQSLILFSLFYVEGGKGKRERKRGHVQTVPVPALAGVSKSCTVYTFRKNEMPSAISAGEVGVPSSSETWIVPRQLPELGSL